MPPQVSIRSSLFVAEMFLYATDLRSPLKQQIASCKILLLNLFHEQQQPDGKPDFPCGKMPIFFGRFAGVTKIYPPGGHPVSEILETGI